MVFVTGATGFLGSYLCLYLSQKGYRIKASKRPDSKIPTILQNKDINIEWVDVDLMDFFDVKDHLEGCKAIFHCAAVVSFSEANKKSLWETNVNITSNIVNVALDLDGIHMVHVSSIAAVGDAKPGKQIDESCRWVYKKSDSNYSITKFEAEREVWRGIHEGLKAVIVNPFVILGYDERGQGSMGFIAQIKNGLSFYTSGKTGFVDVNDVAQTMISLYELQLSGERYIVSGVNYTYQTVLDTISIALNKKKPSIAVSKWFLTSLASIIQLFNKNHPLNTFTAKSAFHVSEYSTQKLLNVIPINFTSLETSIHNMVNKKIV